MPKNKKILFVCPYPFGEAPSQRFRYEQYLGQLSEAGYSYTIAPFLSLSAWRVLYKKGRLTQKIWSLIIGFGKRKWLLLKLKPYDYIFIHREATPIGPPFFEWIIKFIWKKHIIYDFDDAIWLKDAEEKGSLRSIVKWKSKVASICKWSDKISCGNPYLADFALKYNKEVIVNPTTIDTELLHLPKKQQIVTNPLVVGWTGTHSTLQYLQRIRKALHLAYQNTPFKLLIIANKVPDFHFPNMEFIEWNKATEIADLNKIDIGIMPLSDDQWSNGKCGFKALQYMALEKPVVGSAVGVNKRIIPNGGFLVTTEEEWVSCLVQLLKDPMLRKEHSINGRDYIKKHYSVLSNTDNFLYLFR